MASLKEQYQALVEKQDYRDAIALLEKHNPKGAAKEIERLQGLMQQAQPAKRGTDPIVVIAVIIAIVLVGFVGAVAFNGYQQGQQYAFQFRVQGACRDIYWDEWTQISSYTLNQAWEGCEAAAEAAIKSYADEVNYCYGNQSETDARFNQCLEDNGVVFLYSYIHNAPKE